MASLNIIAPAKLNLFLHITGRRADGYHLLDSLVAFTAFGDRLDFTPAGDIALTLSGPFAGVISGEDNLVLRAARLLQQQAGIKEGAHIALHKHIPVGAGLGGGSADAAATLRGLVQLWHLSMDEDDLQALALQLGSDVPVCLRSHMAWMRGVGEQVTPVTCNTDIGIVLANPGIPLLTADIFHHFASAFLPSCAIADTIVSQEQLMQFIEDKENMLTAPAQSQLPVIADMLGALHATSGCRLARMSGSGASCFGLYADKPAAERAAQQLRQQKPEWWCVATSLQKQPV